MSFSQETQAKIKIFAKEQAQHYLDSAEMTYMEKLRRKSGQAKQKMGRKLARFRNISSHAREAQNDMILFISDYMTDLMSKGFSEQEAFEKAKAEMSASEETGLNAGLQEKLREYYENRSPADYEAIGLFYGGFLFIGIVAGALAAYIVSGGRHEFLNGGWIDILVGTAAGAVLGIGLGEISHAIISANKK